MTMKFNGIIEIHLLLLIEKYSKIIKDI